MLLAFCAQLAGCGAIHANIGWETTHPGPFFHLITGHQTGDSFRQRSSCRFKRHMPHDLKEALKPVLRNWSSGFDARIEPSVSKCQSDSIRTFFKGVVRVKFPRELVKGNWIECTCVIHFPENDLHLMDCWFVYIPILYFNCQNWLKQFHSFGSPVGPLIGRYCGTMVPPEIQSSTGILSLSFHTDMAVAKDGFSARYNMTHKEVSESKWKKISFCCTF